MRGMVVGEGGRSSGVLLYCQEAISRKSIVYVGAMTGEKTRLPCIQTRCYWFVELEKRGNIPKLNCFRCQFKVPLSSHRSLIFQGVHMTYYSRCHLYSVTTGWMLVVFLFFWGRTMRTMVQHVDVRQRKVQHYITL